MAKKKQSGISKYINTTTLSVAVVIALCAVGTYFLLNQEPSKAQASIETTTYDWGEMPIMGGSVEHEFTIENTGTDPLEIRYIETSCMCTQAQLVKDNEEGPMFGMRHTGDPVSGWTGEIAPGEEGKIHVVFDPLFHGPNGTGPITRVVSMRTNDPNNSELEFRLTGTVIPGDKSTQNGYEDVSAEEVKTALDESDPFVIDVHIPEQAHIDGTDAFIDYTKITENVDRLPEDKDTEIILYCRSGSMSKEAAETLVDLGYTNVKNLEGGIIEWEDAGYSVDESLIGNI